MKQAPKTRWIGLLTGVTLLFHAAIQVEAQSIPEIARDAFGSTLLLVMEDSNGQPLSLGSGFFVADNAIASNLHVIQGAGSGYARLVGQRTKYEIEGVIATDARRDLVILKTSGAHAPPLSLGKSDTVQVGEPVYAVGNPQGLEGTFSQGIVSGIRQIETDKLLQITAPISPGSSGGPVLNSLGEVIGVSVSTYKGGQNLNFAIPSDYVSALLKKGGPAKSLKKIKTSEAQRSILSDIGDQSKKGVVAGHFSWTDNQFMGGYTFSVRNNLREPIQDILCLVIFYARDGLPIETEFVEIRGPVGGKLAKRSPKSGRIKADEVRNITKNIEVRILDFRLVN